MRTGEATGSTLAPDHVAAIDELQTVHEKLQTELGRIIVGQKEVIDQLAICLFSRGHALLMGVPGLAKTLLVSRLADTMARMILNWNFVKLYNGLQFIFIVFKYVRTKVVAVSVAHALSCDHYFHNTLHVSVDD